MTETMNISYLDGASTASSRWATNSKDLSHKALKHIQHAGATADHLTQEQLLEEAQNKSPATAFRLCATQITNVLQQSLGMPLFCHFVG